MAADARGAYFRATYSLAFGQEAQRIRMVYGEAGFGRYVSIMCLLIGQDGGTFDVSDDLGWELLTSSIGCSEEDAREMVGYLATRGLLDERKLADGLLCAPLVNEGLAEWNKFRKSPGRPRKDQS